MKIAVIGTGFVGVVTAAVYASFGHQVFGLDIDQKKIDKLKKSQVPFYEPNLQELLEETQTKQQLHFTSEYKEAITDANLVVIAVGTPSRPDGSVNLDYLYAACESAAKYLSSGVVVAIKSTVPPGVFTQVETKIKSVFSQDFELASLPEFLKEGSAVHDTLHPDRVVIGASSDAAFTLLETLHAPLKAPVLKLKPESAQMAKYAANAYLATRITFINQIADLCQKAGADVEEVIKAIGLDQRIGSHYWYPGLGYGGSCFPKDVKELAHFAVSVGFDSNLFTMVDQLNSSRLDQLYLDFKNLVGGFAGKTVALLGLAFKPHTDDMREAPSLAFVPKLVTDGAKLKAFDPQANSQAKQNFADFISSKQLQLGESLFETTFNADVIILLTEWPEFISFDYSQVRQTAKQQWIIDTRNRLDAKKLRQLGFVYQGIGRTL